MPSARAELFEIFLHRCLRSVNQLVSCSVDQAEVQKESKKMTMNSNYLEHLRANIFELGDTVTRCRSPQACGHREPKARVEHP